MKWLYRGWSFLIARIENVSKCSRGWIELIVSYFEFFWNFFRSDFFRIKRTPPLVGSITFEEILRILNFRGGGGVIKPYFHTFKLSTFSSKRQLLNFIKILVQLTWPALDTGKFVRGNNYKIELYRILPFFWSNHT